MLLAVGIFFDTLEPKDAKKWKHEGMKMKCFQHFFDTKSRRLKDTKFFYKTKKLLDGKCFQPFELIEHIERFFVTKAGRRNAFSIFFDTKSRRLEGTKFY